MTIYKLAQALNVPMADLLETRDSRSVVIISESEAPLAWSGKGVSKMKLMLASSDPVNVEIWNCVLAPGDRYQGRAHAKGSRESIHLFSGRLILTVAGQSHEMSAGSLAVYEGDLAHSYSNPDEKRSAGFIMTLEHSWPTRGYRD
jgi:quercetin dioxygenase-like cupin family protein